MKKYYRVDLNCGRVKKVCSFYNTYGFIQILPQNGVAEEKTFFGVKYTPITEYIGKFSVIAEKVDDHFEDIILGKTIKFDPDGVRDITTTSIEELENQCDVGLSCYNYVEIEPVVALYYMELIKSDLNILDKYVSELEVLEKKINVKDEIERRLNVQNTSSEELKTKRRFRLKDKIIKSA